MTTHLQRASTDEGLGGKLVGNTVPLDGSDALIGDRLDIYSCSFHVGDIVYHRADAVGVVAACVRSCNGTFGCFVSEFDKVGNATDGASKYRDSMRLVVWEAAAIRLCLAWRRQACGSMFVVRQ